jgi:hypothetical protein
MNHQPKTLCHSCNNYSEANGHGKTYRYCGEYGEEIKFPVEKCNKHEPKNTMSLWQMEQTALYLDARKKETVGFKWLTKGEKDNRVEPLT